jgi:hypothetical protein
VSFAGVEDQFTDEEWTGHNWAMAEFIETADPNAILSLLKEIAELREALKPAEDTLDFGDFVLIEQKRHGVENEWYVHKVIGRHHSNAWVDVPVQTPATTALHQDMEEVVSCICCGVSETEVRRYRLTDVHRTKSERFGQTPAAVLEGSGA